MKSEFRSELITKEIIGSELAELTQPFIYYSAYLEKELIVPAGFICDYESVPLIKGTSKRGGVIHDYLCRIDSSPIVTKKIAAIVYKEAQNCRDQLIIKGCFDRFNKWMRRNIKTFVVRVAFGYFHKHKVFATLEDMTR